MSHSTLYRVYKTKAVSFAEFSNGSGSAPPIWGYLCVNYLHGNSHDWLTKGRGDYKPLWDLATDPSVPEWLRLVHAFTFDYAVVTKKHKQELVAACRTAFQTFSNWPEWSGCVNHWLDIAHTIENAAIEHRCLGIGLGCTSVSDPWEGIKPDRLEKVWDFVGYIKKQEKQS